jgi:hypothetical protein
MPERAQCADELAGVLADPAARAGEGVHIVDDGVSGARSGAAAGEIDTRDAVPRPGSAQPFDGLVRDFRPEPGGT